MDPLGTGEDDGEADMPVGVATSIVAVGSAAGLWSTLGAAEQPARAVAHRTAATSRRIWKDLNRLSRFDALRSYNRTDLTTSAE
jgi:hypothetical protein